MPSDALKQLSSLAYDLNTDRPRLALGPHGARLLTELITAAKGEMWVSVIILSATLVDVAVHEAGQFDVAFDDQNVDAGFGDHEDGPGTMDEGGRLACLICLPASGGVWRLCAPAATPLCIMKAQPPVFQVRVMMRVFWPGTPNRRLWRFCRFWRIWRDGGKGAFRGNLC